jgi:hypothetical protein
MQANTKTLHAHSAEIFEPLREQRRLSRVTGRPIVTATKFDTLSKNILRLATTKFDTLSKNILRLATRSHFIYEDCGSDVRMYKEGSP